METNDASAPVAPEGDEEASTARAGFARARRAIAARPLREAPAPASLAPAVVSGFIGTVLIAFAAMDGGALPEPAGGEWPIPLAHVPEVPGMGVVPILVAHYGGLVLLVRSWLALRRFHPAASTAIAVAALWVVPLLLAPPVGSRDAYSYVAQGEIVQQGLPVYESAADDLPPSAVREAVDPIWFEVPTPYGPAWVELASIAAGLPGPQPVVGVLALRFVTLAGVGLLALAVPRLARRLGRDADDATVLVVANPLVLLHCVAGGHNEALVAALLCAGFAAAAGGRRILGAVICALGGAVKLPGLVGSVVTGWGAEAGTRWRDRIGHTAVAGAASLATLAACSWVTGLGWGWLESSAAPGKALSWAAPTTWFGYLIGADLARLVGLGIAALLALYWTLRAGPADAAAAGKILVAVAVLGPALHPWYLLWGLPLLAAARGGRPNRAFVAASIIGVLAGHPGGGRWFEAVLDVDPALLAVAGGLLLAFLLSSRPLRPPAPLAAGVA